MCDATIQGIGLLYFNSGKLKGCAQCPQMSYIWKGIFWTSLKKQGMSFKLQDNVQKHAVIWFYWLIHLSMILWYGSEATQLPHDSLCTLPMCTPSSNLCRTERTLVVKVNWDTTKLWTLHWTVDWTLDSIISGLEDRSPGVKGHLHINQQQSFCL